MSAPSPTVDNGRSQTREYIDFKTGVVMYDGNPLIGALGPILDPSQTLAFLTGSNPRYEPAERSLPAHLRMHCVRVVGEHYAPTLAQLAVFQEMQVYLRQGYRHRNPLDPKFRAIYSADRKLADRQQMPPERFQHIPLLGTSAVGGAGLGKSVAFLRAAAYYAPRIDHFYEINGSLISFIQVPVLKLDLAPDASTKHLGIEFFDKLGAVVGRDLRSEWGINSCSENSIQPKIYLACRDYNVGLIVVDEVQNMSGTQRKENHVLSYFVRLMNTIGVPIALIGTEQLGSMIQTALAMGRRFTGSIPRFEPFRPGLLWSEFLAQICAYDYTRGQTNWEGLSGQIWELTAGVPDLVVKLITFAQSRVFGRRSEIVDKAVLDETATALFHLVSDRVVKLKAGDRDALDGKCTISELKTRYENLINEQCRRLGIPPAFMDVTHLPIEISDNSGDKPDSGETEESTMELPLGEAAPSKPKRERRAAAAKCAPLTPDAAVARLKELGMIGNAA